MPVNTKTVAGRREVHYASFAELLADAERLAAGDVQMLGNWSLGQIFRHLAKAIHSSIDGAEFRAPWVLRWFATRFLKRRFLERGIPPGFQIPSRNKPQFHPEDADAQTGLAELRDAIHRVTTESKRGENAILNRLTKDESDRFQLRHAELHMSFAVPVD